MATVIMPKMGDAMEEGTLLRWLKNVGDEVEAGDPIAEIETDKVTLEIEAAEAGVLTQDAGRRGSDRAHRHRHRDHRRGGRGPGRAPAAAAPAETDRPRPRKRRQADGRRRNGPRPPPGPEAQPAAATPVAANGAAEPDATAVTAPRASDCAPPRSSSASRPSTGSICRHRRHRSGRADRQGRHHAVHDGRRSPSSGSTAGSGPPRKRHSPTAAATGTTPAAAPQPTGRPAGVARELSRIRRTTGKRMSESKQVNPALLCHLRGRHGCRDGLPRAGQRPAHGRCLQGLVQRLDRKGGCPGPARIPESQHDDGRGHALRSRQHRHQHRRRDRGRSDRPVRPGCRPKEPRHASRGWRRT